MVDILTSTGILLDISPDAEFDLTIENPIFSDERISAPWSTDIAFLPTLRNKRAFGYMGALMSAPSVTELAATIIVQGIHLISGTLIYDGLSDGCLNYTFTSRDLSVDWAKKLYELPFLGDAENGIDYMREVLAGDIDGISAPVIVNAALESDADWNLDEANIGRKYRNAADMDEPAKGFIPDDRIRRGDGVVADDVYLAAMQKYGAAAHLAQLADEVLEAYIGQALCEIEAVRTRFGPRQPVGPHGAEYGQSPEQLPQVSGHFR